MLLRQHRPTLLLGCCLLLLVGILWYIIGLFQDQHTCLYCSHSTIRIRVWEYAPLPSYRSATGTRVWEEDASALPHGEVRGKKRTIIFQTQDTAEAVLAFYRTELLRQGWEISSYSTTTGDQLKFLWSHGALEQRQALIITVYTNNPEQRLVSIVQRPSLGLAP